MGMGGALPKRLKVGDHRQRRAGLTLGAGSPASPSADAVSPTERSELERMLRAHSLLADAADELLYAVRSEEVTAGTVVVQEGSTSGGGCYLVRRGRLEAVRHDVQGVLRTMLPGDLFGEVALVYNSPRTASVVAREASALFTIDREAYHRALQLARSKAHLHLDVLGRIPLLSTLTRTELARVAATLREEAFDDGDVIFAEGDPITDGSSLYILTSGCARLTHPRVDAVVDEAASDDVAQVKSALSPLAPFPTGALLTASTGGGGSRLGDPVARAGAGAPGMPDGAAPRAGRTGSVQVHQLQPARAGQAVDGRSSDCTLHDRSGGGVSARRDRPAPARWVGAGPGAGPDSVSLAAAAGASRSARPMGGDGRGLHFDVRLEDVGLYRHASPMGGGLDAAAGAGRAAKEPDPDLRREPGVDTGDGAANGVAAAGKAVRAVGPAGRASDAMRIVGRAAGEPAVVACPNTCDSRTLVDSVDAPGFFGESALMLQSSVRSSTAHAVGRCTCLCLDVHTVNALLSAEVSRVLRARVVEACVSRVPLLRPLLDDASSREALCARFEERQFPPGYTVIAEGEPPSDDTALYIILDGAVVISSYRGGREHTICTRYATDWFGELSVLSETPRTATVRVSAASPCTCLLMRRRDVLALDQLEKALRSGAEQRRHEYSSLAARRHADLLRISESEEPSDCALADVNARWCAAVASAAEPHGAPAHGPPLSGPRRPSSATSFPSEVHSVEVAMAAVCPSELRAVAVLGVGSYGRVLLVEAKPQRDGHRRQSGRASSQPVGCVGALKVVRKTTILLSPNKNHVLQERRLMQRCRHPNIVRLFSAFHDTEHVFFLTELCAGGDLFARLVAAPAGRLPASEARFYAACVVLALEYLGSHSIAYRDLKPENLLLDHRGYCKLADFGFATEIRPGEGGRAHTMCGTPEYMAPEMLQHNSPEGYGTAVDWWALGILVFEMLAGRSPFAADQPMQVYRNIMQASVPPLPPHPDMTDTAERLILALLTARPSQRLGALEGGASDVKVHDWFAGIDWEALENRALDAPFVPELDGPFDSRYFPDCATDTPRLDLCPAAAGGSSNASDHFAEFGTILTEGLY